MRRKLTYIVMAVTAFIIGAFIYPTTSSGWKITWEIKELGFKQAFLSQTLSDTNPEKQPNILFIVADDLGKFEVSAYGSKTMHTPHIDQLAKEGVLFTDCYVNAPICSPSRAGMLTGRYPQRFGFETQPMDFYPDNMAVFAITKYIVNTGDFVLVTPPDYPTETEMLKQGLPPTEMNLAELLKMRNYHTACIGKWHLGTSGELIPNARGFDEQYGFYGASSLYSEKRDSPGMVNYIQPFFSSEHQWETGREKNAAILRNNKVITEKRYLTFAIMEEGLDFMESNMNKKDPFFLYLSFNAPHVPFQAPLAYYEKHADEKDKNKRVYYAMIHALVDAIGTLMDKMKTMGLEENTIIYFISDNGGAAYTKATDNGPYKGGKLTDFEGGVNVPCMMKWKGHLPEGMVFDKPISSMDLFTTSIEVANCLLPDDRVYDGVNLLPYLSGENKNDPHEVFYWRSDHIHAMRKGDYKFLMSTRDNWAELYKISEDKYEKYDLSREHPEIIDELQIDYDKWQKDLKEPLWPRIMDKRVVIDGKTYLFPA
jgi:arylsulfatase A-like enzyme